MSSPSDRLTAAWAQTDPAVFHVSNALTQGRLRDSVAHTLSGLWTIMAPYNRPEAAKFLPQISALDRGVAMAQTSTTSVHLHQVLSAKLNHDVPVTAPPPPTLEQLRPGIAPEDLWLQPFTTLWWHLGQGDDRETAIRAGLNRALSLVLTNAQRAKTYAAHHVLTEQPGATGWRRITRGSASCAECNAELGEQPCDVEMELPHPLCSCDIDPLVAGQTAVVHTEVAPLPPPDATDQTPDPRASKS